MSQNGYGIILASRIMLASSIMLSFRIMLASGMMLASGLPNERARQEKESKKAGEGSLHPKAGARQAAKHRPRSAHETKAKRREVRLNIDAQAEQKRETEATIREAKRTKSRAE